MAIFTKTKYRTVTGVASEYMTLKVDRFMKETMLKARLMGMECGSIPRDTYTKARFSTIKSMVWVLLRLLLMNNIKVIGRMTVDMERGSLYFQIMIH